MFSQWDSFPAKKKSIDSFSAKIEETPYKDRLVALNLLPLVYGREIKDLVFFYKALSGSTDLNIENLVSFVKHGRTRNKNPTLTLIPSYCKTNVFQASFFNRIVKLWNSVCNLAPLNHFRSSKRSFEIHIFLY